MRRVAMVDQMEARAAAMAVVAVAAEVMGAAPAVAVMAAEAEVKSVAAVLLKVEVVQVQNLGAAMLRSEVAVVRKSVEVAAVKPEVVSAVMAAWAAKCAVQASAGEMLRTSAPGSAIATGTIPARGPTWKVDGEAHAGIVDTSIARNQT